MDSASPIAKRTAGEQAVTAGTTFTFAMRTNKAESTTTRPFPRPAGEYRDVHHRTHGEGHPA